MHPCARSSRALYLPLLLVISAACVEAPEGGSAESEATTITVDTVSESEGADDELIPSAVSPALTARKPIGDPIDTNGLLSGWSLDRDATVSELKKTYRGRKLIKYLARCALPKDKYIRYSWTTDTGVRTTTRVDGFYDLAPDWVVGTPTQAQWELLTACLMAHSNRKGERVPISIRRPGWKVADDAAKLYTIADAVFFGDLRSNEFFVCKVRRPISPYKLTSLDTDRRDCDRPTLENQFVTRCDFRVLSMPCDQYCTIGATPWPTFTTCTNPNTGRTYTPLVVSLRKAELAPGPACGSPGAPPGTDCAYVP